MLGFDERCLFELYDILNNLAYLSDIDKYGDDHVISSIVGIFKGEITVTVRKYKTKRTYIAKAQLPEEIDLPKDTRFLARFKAAFRSRKTRCMMCELRWRDWPSAI